MTTPTSNGLGHFRLLLCKRWTEFNESWKDTRSQFPLPSLCFCADQKIKMVALVSDLLLSGIQRNLPGSKFSTSSTKFFSGRSKTKMTALASDWLIHFRLLFCNRWGEFNESWQEARSQRPLSSLCFSGWSENQDCRPSLWLAWTFSTSSLQPLNWIH